MLFTQFVIRLRAVTVMVVVMVTMIVIVMMIVMMMRVVIEGFSCFPCDDAVAAQGVSSSVAAVLAIHKAEMQ